MEGQGDVVSGLALITHIVTLIIPIMNLLTKSTDPPSTNSQRLTVSCGIQPYIYGSRRRRGDNSHFWIETSTLRHLPDEWVANPENDVRCGANARRLTACAGYSQKSMSFRFLDLRSADENRLLIGDDEHAWTDKGVGSPASMHGPRRLGTSFHFIFHSLFHMIVHISSHNSLHPLD